MGRRTDQGGRPGRTTIEVLGRKFRIPFECPCCGAVPDTEIRVAYTRKNAPRVGSDTSRAYDFPCCRRCAAHVARWDSAGVASAGMMVLGMMAGAIVGIFTHVLIGGAIVVAATVVASLLARTRRTRANA